MAVSNDLRDFQKQISYERSVRDKNRRGFAFLIEALVVLAFLMGCLAVFVQLFSSAQLEGLSANRLSQAVVAATNRAEEFSANPTNASGAKTEDDLRVDCEVREERRNAGILYHATISVYDERKGDEEVFTLETARYVSGTLAGDAS